MRYVIEEWSPIVPASSPQVLILSKNFAPEVGGGVRRVEALCRFLPKHGFDVQSMASRGEPDIHYRSASDRLRKTASKFRLGRLYRHGARWLSIPDDGILDIPLLLRAVGDRRPDLILASGPPHSILVAARRLAHHLQCPWVADLRDPWTDHPRFDPPSPIHRHLQTRIEARSLDSAAALLTATQTMAENIRIRLMISKPIHAFYNGYDAEACETLVPSSSEAISVGYFGSFYGPIDPGPLVRAVAGSGAQLLHAGADYDRQLQQAAQKSGLQVSSLGMLSPEESFKRMQTTQILAMVLPDDPAWAYCRTQKLAEYLASRRPILALVPKGEAADLIEKYEAGISVRPHDTEAAIKAISDLSHGQIRLQVPPPELSWQSQIAKVADFLRSLL